MSTGAREEILGRVRDALAGSRGTQPVIRGYRRRGALEPQLRADLFVARVADYQASVHRVARESLPAEIAQIARCATFGIPEGLVEEWRPGGAVVDQGLSTAELDALDGAITGCTVAIAETGTIVLAGRAHEGRRALTLVPDLHVCVVEAHQIVETVPEAIDQLASFAACPLTFISGPSATSDIELNRVEGVHGPRRLAVLVVE